MKETQDRGRIVVGVDGSVAGELALQWAVQEARTRRLDIDVVHAWSPPLSIYPVDLAVDAAVYRAAGADVLARALAGVDDLDGDLHITSHLTEADAAHATYADAKMDASYDEYAATPTEHAGYDYAEDIAGEAEAPSGGAPTTAAPPSPVPMAMEEAGDAAPAGNRP